MAMKALWPNETELSKAYDDAEAEAKRQKMIGRGGTFAVVGDPAEGVWRQCGKEDRTYTTEEVEALGGPGGPVIVWLRLARRREGTRETSA